MSGRCLTAQRQRGESTHYLGRELNDISNGVRDNRKPLCRFALIRELAIIRYKLGGAISHFECDASHIHSRCESIRGLAVAKRIWRPDDVLLGKSDCPGCCVFAHKYAVSPRTVRRQPFHEIWLNWN
jgi:hypothetical protein